MATSGSSNFTATRNQIIRQAALDVGAIGANVAMPSSIMSDFAFRLNALVKRWGASGMHVWTTEEGVLFPQAAQAKYAIAVGGADHATLDSEYVQTQLAAAAGSGATSIYVDSTTGMADGDNIGIIVSDGTVHWTTINGTPGATVVLTSGLDASAAEDAYVFSYTNKIVRPLRIVQARRHLLATAEEVPLNSIPRLDYRSLHTKTNTGPLTQYFYDRQLTSGFLYLWYPPATVTEIVKFTWHRPIEDFDAASDNPDLPQEWISALISNLANDMKVQYTVGPQRSRELEIAAARTLDAVTGLDRDTESVFFQPDTDAY